MTYYCVTSWNGSSGNWLTPAEALADFKTVINKQYPEFTNAWLPDDRHCQVDNGIPQSQPYHNGITSWLEKSPSCNYYTANGLFSLGPALGASCGCAADEEFFNDTKTCVKVGTTTLDAEVENKGPPPTEQPPCDACAEPKAPPPVLPPTVFPQHVGQPIDPTTGNMWHVELDYVSQAPGGLVVARTYNSSFSSNSSLNDTFGTGWSSPFGVTLRNEVVGQKFKWVCKIRLDTGAIYFCPDFPVALSSNPDAVSISRGDGKRLYFERKGTVWTSSSPKEEISATYNAQGSEVTAWTFTSATSGTVEQFDRNGLLLSITQRNGRSLRMTYSDGQTNDTNAGRIPGNGPICLQPQAGAVLPLGRLLCVTDSWGQALNYEYNGAGRIVKMIDPAGQATLYEYDGPSGGCLVPSNDNPSCSANNLTKVTYSAGTSRIYYYAEPAQINSDPACKPSNPNVSIHLMTGLVDENGNRFISWKYCKGLAYSSELGQGIDRIETAKGWFEYDYGSEGGFYNYLTRYSGTAESPATTTSKQRYNYVKGDPKLARVFTPCPEWPNAVLSGS